MLILHHRAFEQHCSNLNVSKPLWRLISNEVTSAHKSTCHWFFLTLHSHGTFPPHNSVQSACLGSSRDVSCCWFKSQPLPNSCLQINTPSSTCSYHQSRTSLFSQGRALSPVLSVHTVCFPFLCPKPSWVLHALILPSFSRDRLDTQARRGMWSPSHLASVAAHTHK